MRFIRDRLSSARKLIRYLKMNVGVLRIPSVVQIPPSFSHFFISLAFYFWRNKVIFSEISGPRKLSKWLGGHWWVDGPKCLLSRAKAAVRFQLHCSFWLIQRTFYSAPFSDLSCSTEDMRCEFWQNHTLLIASSNAVSSSLTAFYTSFQVVLHP